MPAIKKPVVITSRYHASRSVPVVVSASGGPASLDEATRSVEMIASTEAPATVMDWERWEPVQEVLLMSGCHVPPSGQVPLLDTHSRESVSRVLGSFRAPAVKQTEHGPALVGRSHFSIVEEANNAFTKVKEGHITDVSVGYAVNAYIWLEEGQTTVVEGRTFTGPLRIATDWMVGELSLCPIGADTNAKIRAAQLAAPKPPGLAGKTRKEKPMGNTVAKRSGLVARLRNILGLRAEDEKKEEEREDTAEMTEEELLAEVEGLEAALAEAEEAEKGEKSAVEEGEESEEKKPEEGTRKATGTRAAAPVNSAASATRAAMVERARITGIRTLATEFNLAPEQEEKLITSGTGLSGAKAQVLDMLKQRSTANPGPGYHVSMGRTEGEKFNSAASDALMLRCGLPLWKNEPGTPAFKAEQAGQRSVREATAGAHELQGYSLRELAREMLVRSGQQPGGHVMQMMGRALSTTDLPRLLVDTSRRCLMDAFEAAPETWRTLFTTGVATDFKKSTAVGIEGDVKPLRKREGGEYKNGKFAEHAEEYKIETYGRKMAITREALINDDLNALTALPAEYGRACAELVGDVAYAALLSNPLMGDGVKLFDANKHRNLFAGCGGVPTVENLGKVVTAMKLQKDSFGKTVTITPKFFLASVAMETSCNTFFDTALQGAPIIGTQAQPLVTNPYGGSYFVRVHDRRLDDISADDFYLLAQRGTVVVYFLNGVEAPFIDEIINFNNDCVESKVRMDVGAKMQRAITAAKATKQ